MPGTPLRSAPGTAGFAAVEALLDALPAVDRPVRGHLERVGHFAAILRLTVPEVVTDIAELAGRLPAPEVADPVPVHGDLHEGQVLVVPVLGGRRRHGASRVRDGGRGAGRPGGLHADRRQPGAGRRGPAPGQQHHAGHHQRDDGEHGSGDEQRETTHADDPGGAG